MSDEAKKKISKDEYLRAFALFTMAKQHVNEAGKFALGLAKLLGREDVNALDGLADAIYSDWKPFDEALRIEGFEVEE